MGISGISSTVNSAVNQTSQQSVASVSVLKKALDTQAASALTLINAIPEAPQPSGSIGGKINVVA